MPAFDGSEPGALFADLLLRDFQDLGEGCVGVTVLLGLGQQLVR